MTVEKQFGKVSFFALLLVAAGCKPGQQSEKPKHQEGQTERVLSDEERWSANVRDENGYKRLWEAVEGSPQGQYTGTLCDLEIEAGTAPVMLTETAYQFHFGDSGIVVVGVVANDGPCPKVVGVSGTSGLIPRSSRMGIIND